MLRAYPIRGIVPNNTATIMLRNREDNVLVLNSELEFIPLDQAVIDNVATFIVEMGSAGFLLTRSNLEGEPIQYPDDSESRSFRYIYVDGTIVRESQVSSQTPTTSLTVDRLWSNAVTGAYYTLDELDHIRFLPLLLLSGESEIRNQQVINIEKAIWNSTIEDVRYFTTRGDAEDGVLYRYNYQGICTPFSKGYCSSTASCRIQPGTTWFSCTPDVIEEEDATSHFRATMIIFFIILAVILMIVLITFAIASRSRPDTYFDDTDILDVDDWN